MQQVRGEEARGQRLKFSQYRRDHGYGRTYEALAVDMRAGIREYGGAGGADGDNSSAASPARHAISVSPHHRGTFSEVQEAAATAAVG